MTEVRFTQPVPKGEQWVVTLYAPASDIRYAMYGISRVPGIPGLQMILSTDTPDSAEIRFRGSDSWANIMADLDLVFTFIPIAQRQQRESGQRASQGVSVTAMPMASQSKLTVFPGQRQVRR